MNNEFPVVKCHAHKLLMIHVETDPELVEEVGPFVFKCPKGCVAGDESRCIVCPLCAEVMAPLVALVQNHRKEAEMEPGKYYIKPDEPLTVLAVKDDKTFRTVAQFSLAPDAQEYLRFLNAKASYPVLDNLANEVNSAIAHTRATAELKWLLEGATAAHQLWVGIRELFGIKVSVPAPLSFDLKKERKLPNPKSLA
jgi:hypothetical protein